MAQLAQCSDRYFAAFERAQREAVVQAAVADLRDRAFARFARLDAMLLEQLPGSGGGTFYEQPD